MAGFAAVEKEKQKDKKYRETAESLGHIFRPIAIEAFRRWGPKAEELLTDEQDGSHAIGHASGPIQSTVVTSFVGDTSTTKFGHNQ